MARKPLFGFGAASIALLAVQAAPVEASGEGSRVHSIASETISISVTVATRYQLRAAGAPRENRIAGVTSRQFCLDSNAAPGSLPVRLLRFGASPPGPAETAVAPSETATVTSIAPCIPREGWSKAGSALSDRLQGVEVMLIQPE